jgi:hypothetical protein
MLAITREWGLRLVEIAGLFILITGVWLVAAEIPAFKFARTRTLVSGVALAAAGVLVIVAVRWGHVG